MKSYNIKRYKNGVGENKLKITSIASDKVTLRCALRMRGPINSINFDCIVKLILIRVRNSKTIKNNDIPIVTHPKWPNTHLLQL